MKNKKAQFYLVAAVVIVAAILGLSVVSNYAVTRKKPERFYALSDELKEECARIIDYGIYNELDISALVQDFIENYFAGYAKQKDVDVEFVLVYGETENIKIATYEDGTLNIERVGYETIFEDADADYVCADYPGGNINENNKNVLLRNCDINGKVEVSGGGGLKIDSSTIDGNILISGTNLELTNSHVTGKVDAKDGNITIINNTIDKEVHVEGGTFFLTDNIIHGSVNTKQGNCPEILQIGDNVIDGGIDLCRGVSIIIDVELLDGAYIFNTKEGKNCLFIMAKEEGGEVHIITNE